MDQNFPPSQKDVTSGILRALVEGGATDRAKLKERLEHMFAMTDIQRTIRGFGQGPLWDLRFRHAINDLTRAKLILVVGKGGRGKFSDISVAAAGVETLANGQGAINTAVRLARRGNTEPTPTARRREGHVLPKCGEVLRAILETLVTAAHPLTSKEMGDAISVALGVTEPVRGHKGHDMLRARIATSSHRLWKAGLLDRFGNGRHIRSEITDLGRKSLANTGISPVKLPAALLRAA